MKSQGLAGKPEDVANLKGDDARVAFIKHFKEVQRLQTQLDQYTDLTPRAGEDDRDASCPRTSSTPSAASTWKPPSGSRQQQGKPGG